MKKLLLLLLTFRLIAFEDSGAPNLSDRRVDKPSNIDAFIDVLYWQPSESFSWAFTLSSNGNSEQVAYKMLVFEWTPGFRVGLGYNMEYDGWDMQLFYTRFQSNTKAKTSGNVTPAFIASVPALYGSYEAGALDWTLRFNIFDFSLGRSFWVSQDLSLRPMIGLKGGWINQMIYSQWQNPLVANLIRVEISVEEHVKHNFLGGGPLGGVRGQWALGCVRENLFSLIGDMGAAYMWGRWTINDELHGGLTSVSVPVGNRNFGSFVLQSFFGLGLDTSLRNGQSHFSAKLGYEIQDWINQLQIFDHSTGGHNNDLILQGGSLNFRFDF